MKFDDFNYERFIQDRIARLLNQKGANATDLCLYLGKSKSYVYNFVSGRALPPMREFIEICRFFNITPQQFFDPDTDDPHQKNELLEAYTNLNETDRQMLLQLAKHLQNK